MTNYLYPVISDPATNFTQALAQFAATPMNNIAALPLFGPHRFYIRAIQVIAKENFGPELNFFSTSAGFTTSVSTDGFLGRWSFLSQMGEQIGGSGLWRYYIEGLTTPYYDLDAMASLGRPSLHVIVQNMSATAKSADAAGAMQLTVWLEPFQAGL